MTFFCTKLGKQYRPIFNQYLKYAKPPILKIYKRQKGKKLELHYKLEAQESNFELPIGLKISNSKEQLPPLKPQKEWQKIKLKLSKNQTVDFEQDLYYFLIEDTST